MEKITEQSERSSPTAMGPKKIKTIILEVTPWAGETSLQEPIINIKIDKHMDPLVNVRYDLSEANIMSKSFYDTFFPENEVLKSTAKVKWAGESPVKVIGKI